MDLPIANRSGLGLTGKKKAGEASAAELELDRLMEQQELRGHASGDRQNMGSPDGRQSGAPTGGRGLGEAGKNGSCSGLPTG